MGFSKTGQITNGKELKVRVPMELYEQLIKDKNENTSVNEIVYEILINHLMEEEQKLSIEKIDIFSSQLAKTIHKDNSEKSSEGLLLESYLQIIRSKILKKIEDIKKEEFLEHEEVNHN